MLSYFSRSPTSSSPEYKKGRYQVLEVDNEDNSLEDQTVKDTFQDAPPWISALYNEMKSARKEMAQVKIIRDELTQVRSILNDFLNFKKETFSKLDDFKKSVDSVRSSMTNLQNVIKAWSEKLIRFAKRIRSSRVS